MIFHIFVHSKSPPAFKCPGSTEILKSYASHQYIFDFDLGHWKCGLPVTRQSFIKGILECLRLDRLEQ